MSTVEIRSLQIPSSRNCRYIVGHLQIVVRLDPQLRKCQDDTAQDEGTKDQLENHLERLTVEQENLRITRLFKSEVQCEVIIKPPRIRNPLLVFTLYILFCSLISTETILNSPIAKWLELNYSLAMSCPARASLSDYIELAMTDEIEMENPD